MYNNVPIIAKTDVVMNWPCLYQSGRCHVTMSPSISVCHEALVRVTQKSIEFEATLAGKAE